MTRFEHQRRHGQLDGRRRHERCELRRVRRHRRSSGRPRAHLRDQRRQLCEGREGRPHRGRRGQGPRPSPWMRVRSASAFRMKSATTEEGSVAGAHGRGNDHATTAVAAITGAALTALPATMGHATRGSQAKLAGKGQKGFGGEHRPVPPVQIGKMNSMLKQIMKKACKSFSDEFLKALKADSLTGSAFLSAFLRSLRKFRGNRGNLYAHCVVGLSLRGSARNRGNPVRTASRLSLRGSARNRGNPFFDEKLDCGSVLRLANVIARFRKNRGNPFFDERGFRLAALQMTAGLASSFVITRVSVRNRGNHSLTERTGLFALRLAAVNDSSIWHRPFCHCEGSARNRQNFDENGTGLLRLRLTQ